ncbi:hypothetical protein EV426DRAFT_296877 [Tirmania nivea]|nr:hypothetical protein EV426DRAFT_296877 [Tirmania nivea]
MPSGSPASPSRMAHETGTYGVDIDAFRQPGKFLPRYLFFSSQCSRPSVSLFLAIFAVLGDLLHAVFLALSQGGVLSHLVLICVRFCVDIASTQYWCKVSGLVLLVCCFCMGCFGSLVFFGPMDFYFGFWFTASEEWFCTVSYGIYAMCL